jgi:hypothetical protein
MEKVKLNEVSQSKKKYRYDYTYATLVQNKTICVV